ncbi:glycosyl hydrolase family 8 [Bosea sp. BIWAKO-01]|uniref:glycosyl hydrolase family 8 n=1 Tax=Bosea sp. BIWAKO-01 TaxID=506668 RepID=UPI000853D0FD|nr:glycosyl hydrolase family 8 [Bosea sp. BIWAKO-01]GAU85822.1 endoglucanase precursor [Bosea sp. BIWAKO-01]
MRRLSGLSRMLGGATLAGLCLASPLNASGTAQDDKATIGLAAAKTDMTKASTTRSAAPLPAKPRGAELLVRLWPAYRDRFITPEGRVIDNGNGGISHSEGQGYAMVLAAAAQDRETFDRLWAWTSRELGVRPDGLSAWRWQADAKPNVTDTNNASDGDILIAWALGEAGIRWEEPRYTQAMQKITAAVFRQNVVGSRVGPVLLPGAVGFGAKEQPDGPIVNLSYWIFPAIDRLQKLDPAQDWAALRRSGLALLRESRFGPLKLPPEWLSVGAQRSAPAAQFERSFGYNAIRIPLYLAWSSRAATDHLLPYLTMWNQNENIGPFVIEIDDGKAREPLDAAGYKMVFALVQCVANNKPVPTELATRNNELYYPSTLGLLSLLAISERRPQCL